MANRPECLLVIDPKHTFARGLTESLPDVPVRAFVLHEFGPAMAILRDRQFDLIILEYSQAEKAQAICEEARMRNIPVVFTTPCERA